MKTKPKVIVAILVILISTLPGCRQGARPAAPGNEDDGEMDLALNPAGTLVWSKVSLGGKHGCAIASNKTLWCWGDNGKAQIGDGTGTQRIDPKQINSATNWNQLSAGAEHTCAKKTDGTLWCWGDNSSGKLGIGDKPNQFQSSPCKVTKAKDWKTVSSGTNHTCALKSDGTLWCWGDNSVGELGIGNTVIKKSPVKVNKATNWKTVSAGDNFTCGRKAGTVWCWGKSDQGQLGNGTTTEFKWLPVRAGLATNWTLVAAGGNHACGRRSDGSLWCWGDNQYGQLGDGSTLDKKIPTRVGLENTWVAVAAGANHTCGKKSDSTVWCWGENHDFQLGDGTSVDRNAPVQLVDNLHNAIIDLKAVSIGSSFSCAQKSNGTIYAWGKNNSGQLGDGTTVEKPNPVSVPDPYRSPVLGVWFTDPNKHDNVDGVGLKWVFKDTGVFEMYGAFCNDPAPCMFNSASTYTDNNGKLVITGFITGYDLAADYSLTGNVLKLSNVVFTPSADFFSSMTMLRENSFTVTQITPDPGAFTIDGQITGTETDGISSQIWDNDDDNSGGGNGVNHIDVNGMYLARTGTTLYVQVRLLKGFSNQVQYFLFFERDGDMGINDENEVVALNWKGENPGTVMNTKWLVGGPSDTGNQYPFSSVSGCKAGSVIEFALDLNALGNPPSLLMSFSANHDNFGDSLPNVIVLLP